MNRCANCDAPLTDRWCAACGQKRVSHEDRRLPALLGDFTREVISLDGRFIRSLGALLFRPGLLGRDWLAGRRARWMSPMGLFLFANVLYFIAPGLTDFNLPFSDQVLGRMLVALEGETRALTAAERERLGASGGQVHSAWTAPLVERRVAARVQAEREPGGDGYTLGTYAREYDAQSGNVGKALIAVHVPALAFALMLVFRNRRLYFAEHLVVALHAFTFVLLLVELVVLPSALLAQAFGNASGGFPLWLRVGTGAILIAYPVLAFRIAYGAPWWHAALGAAVWIAALAVANLWVYRTPHFLITFAMT